MVKYIDVIGWLHTALGGIGSALGVIAILVPFGLFAYGIYDFVYGIVYLMAGPQYIPHALENLVQMVILSAVLAVPAVLFLALFGIELYAGVSLLWRWPRARVAGLAAVVPSFFLGLPGIALGVGTVMVLNDDEVKAALG